jgi:hypothetical protein
VAAVRGRLYSLAHSACELRGGCRSRGRAEYGNDDEGRAVAGCSIAGAFADTGLGGVGARDAGEGLHTKMLKAVGGACL